MGQGYSVIKDPKQITNIFFYYLYFILYLLTKYEVKWLNQKYQRRTYYWPPPLTMEVKGHSKE